MAARVVTSMLRMPVEDIMAEVGVLETTGREGEKEREYRETEVPYVLTFYAAGIQVVIVRRAV